MQFHWTAEGDADFAAFLGRLQRDKRKKIQQEQRRVREAGVVFEGKVEIVGAAEGPPKVLKAGTYKDKAYEL